MAVITRASLPEEFFDITSAQMLIQPEPQYLYAQLAKMAVAKGLSVGQMGWAANRSVPNQGASYLDNDQMRYLLSDSIYTDAIRGVSGLGTGPGHTIRMNRPKFADTTYTQASRTITSGSTISTTPIDLQSEQVPVTVVRFGGPYDQTNSRVAPFAVDEFDAKRSVHSLYEVIGMQLIRDFDKWLDTVMVTLFNLASTTLWPSGMTADNDSTVANDFPMDVDTLFRAERTLDEANIPTFPNGRRVAVLTPLQCQQLKNDSQFARYGEFFRDVNPLFPGAFLGQCGNLDIFKSNTLDKANNSSSVPIHKANVFGPGMVGVGVGEMPRILSASDDNYGLQAKVIWEFEAGFAALDTRFGLSVHTS